MSLGEKIDNVAVSHHKTRVSIGSDSVWSESSLPAGRKFGSLVTHRMHSEDSNRSRPVPRLIWVFARRKLNLFVLWWQCSNILGSLQKLIFDHRIGFNKLRYLVAGAYNNGEAQCQWNVSFIFDELLSNR